MPTRRFAAPPLPGAGDPLQVCDLQDARIQALLQRPPLQPACSIATGRLLP